MKLDIHDLIQGTPAWCQFRLDHDGASEAAAMLGLSTKVKRTELLHMKHTGLAKEFSDWVQTHVLDHGHAVEANARPLVEAIVGDLYPVTCSLGRLSASCDGLTMDERIAFEHKQTNAALSEAVAAGELPEEYMPQCQQVLMVTGAEKLIFVVSDGTPENFEYLWVTPDQQWFERILAGWDQFAIDLASYQPRELAEKPAPAAIMQLPALSVQIRGEVTLSNLPAFKAAAEHFIANIKTDLTTDSDFADAEATVKFCEKAEKDLELAKSSAIAQTASIDELMRTIDFIQGELRSKRLTLNKLVTSQKEAIKAKIMADAKQAFADHMASLENEITPCKLACVWPDFAGAIKGKRTLASLHDAVDSALANGKIAADAIAKAIRARLTWYRTAAADHLFLFNDMQQIIQKADDDFQMLVKSRIADHKVKEAARVAQIQEDARIAAEAKVAADAEKARVLADVGALSDAVAATEKPAPVIVQSTPIRVAVTAPPTLRLGQIGERLGFALTAEFLKTLGFEHATRDKSALLFHESDFAHICAALVNHINRIQAKQAA